MPRWCPVCGREKGLHLREQADPKRRAPDFNRSCALEDREDGRKGAKHSEYDARKKRVQQGRPISALEELGQMAKAAMGS